MSLEKIFKKKVEKADNENCIKIINSEVKILDIFSVYKYLLRKFKPGNFYIINLTRWREEMLKYLSSYRPKQEEVETLYEKINSYENKHRAFNGVFLTAVVQHMFNSGEKKFEIYFVSPIKRGTYHIDIHTQFKSRTIVLNVK